MRHGKQNSKKHGVFLKNFVIDFANGDMSRENYGMDYSGSCD
jgi:hypothetical protein